MSSPKRYSVVFDLGNVLIDWNPRYLYRKMFQDPTKMEWFLANICTMPWNSTLDAGTSFADAVTLLGNQHPEYKEHIHAYHHRWDEMITGALDDTVAVFKELKDAGIKCYALSNWSDEKFQPTRKKFEFLNWFDGAVISGQIKMIKPDPKIYKHLIDKFALEPSETIFIDDLPANIEAAKKFGIEGILFTSAADLRRRLQELKVLK